MAAEKLLRHVVFFAFKEEATAEDIEQVGKDFLGMPAKIPAIHDIEWGSAINKGPYTHCMLVIFLNAADLKIYAEHPDHKSIGARFHHLFSSVVEIDYWTNEHKR
jgi:hypothetical protein